MKSPMTLAILCGTVMVLLAGTSLWFESQVTIPLPAEHDYLILRDPDRLVWYDVPRFDPKRAGIAVLDLRTDRIQRCTLAQVPLETHTLANGDTTRLESIADGYTLRIHKRDTFEVVRQARVPGCLDGELLNQRYLLGHQSGRLIVCDALSEDPSQVRTAALLGSPLNRDTTLFPVHGMNLVAEVSVKPLTVSQTAMTKVPLPTCAVHVYRIEDESIVPVASWTSGLSDAQLLRQGNTLLSLSPDRLTLEGRDLDTFELVRKDSLPDAMAANRTSTRYRQDLCTIEDLATHKHTTYRLDTLQELPGCEGLTVDYYGGGQLMPNRSQYRLLREPTMAGQWQPGRLVVFDLESNRIVFDRRYDGFPAAELLTEDRLAVADLRSGLTVEIYNLRSGELLKKVRPHAWLLPLYGVWCISAACAAFGWIYFSARAGLTLLTSILLLAACLVPVSAFPLTIHGNADNVGRLATSYSLAILVSASAGVVWIGVSRLQNRTMRWSYQLAVISILAIALAALNAHYAFNRQWMLTGAMLFALFSMCAAAIGLMVLRLLGYRTHWIGRKANERLQPNLGQFFVLNAAVAAVLVGCFPFRFERWTDPIYFVQVLGAAPPVVLPCLFLFALLTFSDRWFGRCLVIAGLLAAWLVVDFIAAFLRPSLFTLRVEATCLRITFATLVITFLWLWAFRLRGCRLLRGLAKE